MVKTPRTDRFATVSQDRFARIGLGSIPIDPRSIPENLQILEGSVNQSQTLWAQTKIKINPRSIPDRSQIDPRQFTDPGRICKSIPDTSIPDQNKDQSQIDPRSIPDRSQTDSRETVLRNGCESVSPRGFDHLGSVGFLKKVKISF